MTTTIAVRVASEMDKFVERLKNLHNYKEGKSWTKSDMIRYLLERGVELVRDEFQKKYGETLTVPKGARTFVLKKTTWREDRNNKK